MVVSVKKKTVSVSIMYLIFSYIACGIFSVAFIACHPLTSCCLSSCPPPLSDAILFSSCVSIKQQSRINKNKYQILLSFRAAWTVFFLDWYCTCTSGFNFPMKWESQALNKDILVPNINFVQFSPSKNWKESTERSGYTCSLLGTNSWIAKGWVSWGRKIEMMREQDSF